MDLDRQLKSENLLLEERTCRTCGGHKNLLSDFYLSRSDTPDLPSSYSYECKDCARLRIKDYYSDTISLGICVICDSNSKLVGKICKRCNKALSEFGYNIDTLKSAVLYLEHKIQEDNDSKEKTKS
tara:strand:- start:587 stop:964 length:378 start_codon:yes stop_codon:yes gene_type:complete